MKKRDLVKLLQKNGFELVPNEGARHDKYRRGNETEMVPRHREVNEELAKAIIKRRGLK